MLKIKINFICLLAAKIIFQKPGRFLACLLFLSNPLLAQQTDTAAQAVIVNGTLSKQIITGPVSYLVDSTARSGILQIERKPFQVPYSDFVHRLYKSPAHETFWLKFELENRSDSPVQVFFFCGDINFTDIYFISAGHSPQYIQGGNLRNFKREIFFIGNISPTVPLRLLPMQKGEIFLELKQRTEEFDFAGIYLYDKASLYQIMGDDLRQIRYFVFFQLLFQGILICQLLYMLFQWMIIRRKEYMYYFFYLLAIVLYFLSKYEHLFSIHLLFTRYPLLTVYLNKTLLILPYFFYFRFVRSFLEMPLYYPVMNKWIVRIEYFLLYYMVFDLVFILITFNVKLQREMYTYILFLVFIASTAFIIYLFREKKVQIYYILSGSLFVGLGNVIGLTLTYLENESILHNIPYKLAFSQAGIILEIFCFTAGLSYKSMSAEKEKIKSQENLIEQLTANELLQSKMQNIRNKIAQDLHDDIGSTLSSISILSNLALKEKNSSQTMNAMNEIKESSITIMEKMDDIVWSINPRNDSLENLLMRIKRLATSLFEARNIDYHITIQENINEVLLAMEWRQHIYLILKEAINNLVKYADATQALIEVGYNQEMLEIILQDNGKGFDTVNPYNGNGLPSMRNRAEIMQAVLDIHSSPGQGTRVLLRIKIK